MDKKEVGVRIKAFMKEKGLTQTKVADMLGIKQSSVSDMISGRRDTVRLALGLANYYSLSSDIFLGSNNKYVQNIAERDIINSLNVDERQNLINNLHDLYKKHEDLLNEACSVMKQIATINKILIIGIE